MNNATTFRDLLVWQKAHEFALAVYRLTQRFPVPEKYGLCAQFRKAAVSVPANIAEGFKKRGKADKLRFFNISQGSLEECRYYLILTKDLGYCDPTREVSLLEDVSRLLQLYSNRIRATKK